MTEDVSPNVKILNSNYKNNNIVTPSSNIAMFVGEFEKGPINEPILISSNLEFKLIFGRATNNYNDWYQIYNYLQYGKSKIWVCRSVGLNYESANNNGNIANTPGNWGNLLTVEIYNNLTPEIKNIFNLYKDEVLTGYYVIIKRKEKIVETHILSTAEGLNSNYISQINLEPGIYPLTGGFSDSPTSKDIEESLELFSKENYDIDIIISSEMFNEENIKLAESRKDCVCFFGVPRLFVSYLVVNNLILTTEDGLKITANQQLLNHKITDKDINNIINYLSSLQKSSYAFCIFGFKVQEDKFTGKNKIVNVVGDIAGLKASASSENPWSLGAGIERGIIKNISRDIMKLNTKQKDLLYKIGVNSLYNNTLMSQKLFVDESFQVNKLHNRNIYNYLKRTAEKISNKYMFDLNTTNLRYSLSVELKLMLEDMMARRGIQAGKVVVKPIDENKVEVSIYIAISNLNEIVKLNFINIGTKEVSEAIQIKGI